MPSDACVAGDGLTSALLDDELKLFECQPYRPRGRCLAMPLLPEARAVIKDNTRAVEGNRGQSPSNDTCSTLSDAAASAIT